MRVYRIEYHQYEYNLTERGGDWHLTPVRVKYVMADNSLDAVDLLRSNDRGRIEIACIEHVCKVDIKK
jgi:hypothetical protein